MDDSDFLERLRQLTGQPDVWDGFSMDNIAEISHDEDDTAEPDYDSDASQDLILHARHLVSTAKPAEARNYKLSKARAFAADSPEKPKTVENLMSVKWNETGLKLGELSPPGKKFVPWRLVKEYPTMFVGKKNSVRAEPCFTLSALHDKGRVWDLFYVHYPPGTDQRPVLFVPTYQFEHLLDVVNASLGTQLTIPPGKNELRFKMIFGAGNTPRPRFLGRSSDEKSCKALTSGIPEPDKEDDWEKATQAGKDEFLDLLSLANKGTMKQKNSEKTREKRIDNHKAWGRSVKRAQRYLGIRQRNSSTTGSTSEAQLPLDISCPPPFAPENSVLFLCIDIEAYEFNHRVVSEVGIATLDAATIGTIAPGEGSSLGSEGWYRHIHCKHLRIKEALWVHNRAHVQGCPGNFDFGKSELIGRDQIAPLIQAIIQREVDGKRRAIVLVFHDTASDVKFLLEEGYRILEEENVIDVLDTKEMDQYMTRSHNPRKLELVLGSLGISYRYLHNAGNDAMYTMRSMVSLALKQRQTSLDRAAKETAKKPASGHVPYAEFKRKELEEGWSSGGEESDGGVPCPKEDNRPKPQPTW
ncbi:good for full DBP5 activity protein 2 [Rhypophila decipiens]